MDQQPRRLSFLSIACWQTSETFSSRPVAVRAVWRRSQSPSGIEIETTRRRGGGLLLRGCQVGPVSIGQNSPRQNDPMSAAVLASSPTVSKLRGSCWSTMLVRVGVIPEATERQSLTMTAR